MKMDEIRSVIRRHPFVPFDIRMNNGRAYEVDHPEFVAISRDGATLYYTTNDDQRLLFLDVRQIASLELRQATEAA
jgi:hypothetical protein